MKIHLNLFFEFGDATSAGSNVLLFFFHFQRNSKIMKEENYNSNDNNSIMLMKMNKVTEFVCLEFSWTGCTGSTLKFSRNFEIHMFPLFFFFNSKNKNYSQTNTIRIEWHHTFDEYNLMFRLFRLI